MQIKVVKKSILDVKADVIVVNLFEGVKHPGGVTGIVNDAFDNVISDYIIKKEKFEGKFGEIYKLPLAKEGKKIFVVGLGKQADFTYPKIRTLTEKVVKACGKNEKKVVSILHGAGVAGLNPELCAQMIAEGASAGGYTFDKYKSDKKENKVEEFIIAEIDATKFKKAEKGAEKGCIIARSVSMSKDLCNDSAQYIYPETLANFAVENSGVKTTVYNKEQIKEMGMTAFLAVGQGSVHEPKFIHMEYKPTRKAKKKIALVGKGITFDSGGLDLKPPASMLTMKDDMSGAAAIIATMRAISELKPDVEVHGIIAACENMPSGSSYKPGDVIMSKVGKSIEIDNTDAEGRVTLADALAYAEELKVDEIFDIATLTGACAIAFGSVVSGILGNDENKVKEFIAVGDEIGERFWQLPMYEEYGEKLKSEIADMKNTGGREGGASAAGIFLSKFIQDTTWVHIDIAGTAFVNGMATGVGVKSFVKYIVG